MVPKHLARPPQAAAYRVVEKKPSAWRNFSCSLGIPASSHAGFTRTSFFSSLLVENKNEPFSSLQTPTVPVPDTDVTFVTQADGFAAPLSPACELSSVLHLQSVFSARATTFWSWFEDHLQGSGLNHKFVSHGEQHRVTASRVHQSCRALF